MNSFIEKYRTTKVRAYLAIVCTALSVFAFSIGATVTGWLFAVSSTANFIIVMGDMWLKRGRRS